jgi:predicted transport protein
MPSKLRTMALPELLPKLLSTAEHLQKKASANEANTKHHLIEPLLAGLGWNLADFSEVDREFKVYDGTFLDYALRVDGKPKLFIEAKALGKSLNDKQFIAQTVNYANNEGVVWCVLTNGLAYHIYKSNEPVPMERKLLFELDLTEAIPPGNNHAVVDALQYLSRNSIQDGKLDAWGESVFVDMRTRAALAKLGKEPNAKFVAVVSGAIDGPSIELARLKASLGRVLSDLAGAKAGALVGAPPAMSSSLPIAKASDVSGSQAKTSYTMAQHTSNKPSAIVDLFEQADSHAMALGEDVQRRTVKQYIGYFAGKRSFFTLEIKQTKIYAYISLPPNEAKPWNADDMRDVTKIGHYGMGQTEFVLRTAEQLPRLKSLIEQSYFRNRK